MLESPAARSAHSASIPPLLRGKSSELLQQIQKTAPERREFTENLSRRLILIPFSSLTSPIITLCVGPEQRLFAAHEDVLTLSPFFSACLKGQFLEAHSKRIDLPDEQPEILSSVLEYLYKGDYYPRLLHNKRKDTWELEDGGAAVTPGGGKRATESTVHMQALGVTLLKDTVV